MASNKTPVFPTEGAARNITVAGGVGSVQFSIFGQLQALLIDVPGAETYSIYIAGASGREYYASPSPVSGDATIIFSPTIPLTGRMTFGVTGASGAGNWSIIPVGELTG